MEIGVFVVGFIAGGLAGIFVMALVVSASMADRRTREIKDKEEAYHDS